jgi:hypothetical protein
MVIALSAMPSVLLVYVVFVVAVMLTDFVFLRLASESFRASLVPYTGWLVSGNYGFTAIFALALMFQQQNRRAIRFSITFILVIQIAFAIYTQSQSGRPNFANPYLTISPWRPVWTILVPSIWIILLHTPGMNRFCRKTASNDS